MIVCRKRGTSGQEKTQYIKSLHGQYPDLLFLASFNFLAFSLFKEFLVFWGVLPFFPKDFRGSARIKNPCSFGDLSATKRGLRDGGRTSEEKGPFSCVVWICQVLFRAFRKSAKKADKEGEGVRNRNRPGGEQEQTRRRTGTDHEEDQEQEAEEEQEQEQEYQAGRSFHGQKAIYKYIKLPRKNIPSDKGKHPEISQQSP